MLLFKNLLREKLGKRNFLLRDRNEEEEGK
jgi:hypothetical protein